MGQEASPIRVLLVDDDAHIRMVIAQELMADPRTLLVGQAASVREGRKAIKQHEFDVLLVDLNLGDGEAFELLEFFRSFRPSAQAVVISVMENDEQVMRAFELGAAGFVGKNSWFGNYAQAVLQVANGGASITPNLARRLLQRFDRTNAAESKRRKPDDADRLSAREKEILRMVASGYTSIEVGSRLFISSMTVNTHLRNIYRKLQVRTRAQAVRFASLRGLF
ncbi:response regulator transcription factor [Acidovorax sp. 56]|uniref:LuxR C-terminal-related transcriptional regulator n=1 Tax=Acidovorax sp. 56 TaxID=2035205 RepID=UPI000C169990|nr:response regulator transcription factor [Acidovorax sp. 56]